MVVHSDLSTVIVEDDENETVVENLKLLDKIAAQISHKLDLRASTSTAALKKMKQQVNSVRTSAQLNSMISCFGRKGFGNSHCKISWCPVNLFIIDALITFIAFSFHVFESYSLP